MVLHYETSPAWESPRPATQSWLRGGSRSAITAVEPRVALASLAELSPLSLITRWMSWSESEEISSIPPGNSPVTPAVIESSNAAIVATSVAETAEGEGEDPSFGEPSRGE